MIDPEDLHTIITEMTSQIKSLETVIEQLVKAMGAQNRSIGGHEFRINSLESSRNKDEPRIELVN